MPALLHVRHLLGQPGWTTSFLLATSHVFRGQDVGSRHESKLGLMQGQNPKLDSAAGGIAPDFLGTTGRAEFTFESCSAVIAGDAYAQNRAMLRCYFSTPGVEGGDMTEVADTPCFIGSTMQPSRFLLSGIRKKPGFNRSFPKTFRGDQN